jgi:hypothetical protein
MDRSHSTALVALLFAPTLFAQPVFHWTLDESAGSVAYEVNNLSNGTLQGGALWDPEGGHHQGACRFDGVDDRVILGPCDLTSGNGNITLSAWVKPDFVTAMERTIIAKTVGPGAQDHIWSIAFVNATALRFRLRTASVTTELTTPTSSIFSGTWYHIAATFDGSAMRIYLNGSLMAQNIVSGAIGFHPQAPASLGAQSTGGHPFSGWIDDVRIYDRALTQTGIIEVLLEQELTTSMEEVPGPRIQPDGRLWIPAGPWTQMRIMDAAGRIITEQRLSGGNDLVDVARLPSAVYLVSLLGSDSRSTWRLAAP